MYQITSKLEINVLSPDVNYRLVSDFAIQHRCRSIVLTPEFIPMALSDRSAKNGKFNIVAAVDFPFGKNFALDKFKNVEPAALGVEGMDILLTPGRTQVETANEMKAMVDFIKGAVNPTVVIRYVVGCYSNAWDDVERALDASKSLPCEIVRVDQNLNPPQVGIDKHLETMNRLKNLTPKVLKLSGNIDLDVIEEALKIDNRTIFDVDISQAVKIVGQIKDRESRPESDPAAEKQ